ncbi:MAG TPA: hypothetical protein VMW63_06835 [Methanoregulaceae archaeon]|nr:hypothetical protein [Methanoregulaceae archaeon]
MTKQSGTGTSESRGKEAGVSNLIEYILITGILLMFMIIIIPVVNVIFIEGPVSQLTSHAYTDIGNGVSTRIVDLYAIIPYYNTATIVTDFDIPDDVVGRDYRVEIVDGPAGREYDKKILISGNNMESYVSLAGIGATVLGSSAGGTTASGINKICYNSSGGGCPA